MVHITIQQKTGLFTTIGLQQTTLLKISILQIDREGMRGKKHESEGFSKFSGGESK